MELDGVCTAMAPTLFCSFSFEAFNITLKNVLLFLHNEGDAILCICNGFAMLDDMRLISLIFQMYKKMRKQQFTKIGIEA